MPGTNPESFSLNGATGCYEVRNMEWIPSNGSSYIMTDTNLFQEGSNYHFQAQYDFFLGHQVSAWGKLKNGIYPVLPCGMEQASVGYLTIANGIVSGFTELSGADVFPSMLPWLNLNSVTNITTTSFKIPGYVQSANQDFVLGWVLEFDNDGNILPPAKKKMLAISASGVVDGLTPNSNFTAESYIRKTSDGYKAIVGGSGGPIIKTLKAIQSVENPPANTGTATGSVTLSGNTPILNMTSEESINEFFNQSAITESVMLEKKTEYVNFIQRTDIQNKIRDITNVQYLPVE